MPSILTQADFNRLDIFNGGWTVLRPNTQGTADNDDMVFNSILNVLVNGQAGNDRITISGGLASTVNGGEGSDQIFGSSGVDIINGGNGNDYIHGGAGIDTLSGGAGTDTLSYEGSNLGVTVNMAQVTAGLIAVSGGHANGDIVSNNFENVVGSQFNDTITGNPFNNVLIGLDGDDTLFSGDGNDTLIGGRGTDTFNGGAGSDTLDYTLQNYEIADFVDVDLVRGTAFVGRDQPVIEHFSSIENVTGCDGNDTIVGDAGANVIVGGDGLDQLFGGAGDDILLGGGGDHIIAGEDAPPDSDELTGGAGADTFRFLNFDDLQGGIINDFVSGTDKIDFSAIDAIPSTPNMNDAFVFGGTGVGHIEVSLVEGTEYEVTIRKGEFTSFGITVNSGSMPVATDFIL